MSNEPMLHDDADDVDVEGFGGRRSGTGIRPVGPPIRGILDGIVLPAVPPTEQVAGLTGPESRYTPGTNANEPVVVAVDRDR